MTALTLSEQLDQKICDKGIILERKNLDTFGIDGLYLRSEKMVAPLIAINRSLKTDGERNVTKSHEYQHHEYGYDNLIASPKWFRDKQEAIVDRATVKQLIPPNKIIKAFRAGCCNLFEFAEYLEISEKFFVHGLELYEHIHGPRFEYEGYIIVWRPLNIEKD